MSAYLVPLAGLVLLCGAWAAFQIWLAKHPTRDEHDPARCPGCDGGTCGGHGVDRRTVEKPSGGPT